MANSSKLRNHLNNDDEGLEVDMSPMIDMVFLLLIFFIVTSTIIIVKQDPEVTPPEAKASKKADDGTGRIVINIRENGDLYDGEIRPLTSDQAVADWIKSQRDMVTENGHKPRLHLRGDKEAVFKHSRRVIKISAENKVEQVVFATYGFSPKQ